MPNILITAIILSGGKSSRMQGNDKGLLLLNNKPLYRHVIDRIKPQVSNIIISSNSNIEQYRQANYDVISDQIPGFLGPLAGIYSGLIHSTTEWNLIVSCDTPFLPTDLVSRLQHKLADRRAAYVFDGEREHPTIMLIHRTVANDIRQYLLQEQRKLLIFLQSIDAISVDFNDEKQSFININIPEELDYWNQQL